MAILVGASSVVTVLATLGIFARHLLGKLACRFEVVSNDRVDLSCRLRNQLYRIFERIGVVLLVARFGVGFFRRVVEESRRWYFDRFVDLLSGSFSFRFAPALRPLEDFVEVQGSGQVCLSGLRLLDGSVAIAGTIDLLRLECRIGIEGQHLERRIGVERSCRCAIQCFRVCFFVFRIAGIEIQFGNRIRDHPFDLVNQQRDLVGVNLGRIHLVHRARRLEVRARIGSFVRLGLFLSRPFVGVKLWGRHFSHDSVFHVVVGKHDVEIRRGINLGLNKCALGLRELGPHIVNITSRLIDLAASLLQLGPHLQRVGSSIFGAPLGELGLLSGFFELTSGFRGGGLGGVKLAARRIGVCLGRGRRLPSLLELGTRCLDFCFDGSNVALCFFGGLPGIVELAGCFFRHCLRVRELMRCRLRLGFGFLSPRGHSVQLLDERASRQRGRKGSCEPARQQQFQVGPRTMLCDRLQRYETGERIVVHNGHQNGALDARIQVQGLLSRGIHRQLHVTGYHHRLASGQQRIGPRELRDRDAARFDLQGLDTSTGPRRRRREHFFVIVVAV